MFDLSSIPVGERGIKFGATVFIGDLRTLVMDSALIYFTKKYGDALKLATHTMPQVAHVMNSADRWGHDTGVMRGFFSGLGRPESRPDASSLRGTQGRVPTPRILEIGTDP